MPHTGTWIETSKSAALPVADLSCPTRARGLKPAVGIKQHINKGRAPHGHVDWNCAEDITYDEMYVVPHTGTWIETILAPDARSSLIVVPHTGTWIET